jgi:hypothetical protein
MALEIASEAIAGEAIAGGLIRNPPTVAVTAPSGPQATETVTVAWTYTSPISKPQYSYRVQILNQYGTSVLYDTGNVVSSDTSFACPFVMSGGSSYRVEVTCSDSISPGSGTSAFSSSLSSLATFLPSRDVGSIYEVAINGQGYLLADTPERPYRRSTGQLQAPRLATGDTPFSEAIERYTFVGMGDWSLGAGQEIANRGGTDLRAFYESENVNPFDDGIRLLPAPSVRSGPWWRQGRCSVRRRPAW